MIRTIAFATALSSLAAQLAADPIVVRGGIHAGFDRLVMLLPENGTWEIVSSARQHKLIIPQHEDGFDTNEALPRTVGTRISDITSNSSDLELLLNCDCTVAGFVLPNGYLVVDVADPAVSGKHDTSRFQYGDLLWRHIVRANTSGLEAQPQAISDSVAKHLSNTQSQLLEEISTAASSGLLLANTSLAKSQSNLPNFDRGERNSIARQNVRVTGSNDIPINAQTTEILVEDQCVAPEMIAVSTWGSDDPFAEQIGMLRDDLYGEFDKVNAAAVLKMAQLYTHFGFGAEARQTLSLSPKLAQKQTALREIAEYMDYGRVQAPEIFAMPQYCDDETALWSVLISGRHNPGNDTGAEKALRTLNALPQHLRTLVAPNLSQILLNSGDKKNAAAAIRILDRSPVPRAPDANLVAAQIEEAVGNSETAAALINDTIKTNSLESPEALIKQVNAQLGSGDPVSAETALLIEAYTYELSDHRLGPELRRAHVLASAKSGQFLKAFDAIQNEDISQFSEVLSEVTQHGDDILFLQSYFKHAQPRLGGLERKLVSDISIRLSLLGFHDIAHQTLSIFSSETMSDADNEIRARHSLGIGNMRPALEILGDTSSPQATELRARALNLLGDTPRAIAELEQAGQVSAATEIAWLADDWQILTPKTTPIFGSAVEMAEQQLAPITTKNGMLSLSNAAIESSVRARETISTLLRDLEITTN